MTKKVAIESIRIDGGTQMRERINTDAVADYAEAYSSDAKMPPLDVFFDGKEYWLGNGFHRYHAVRKIGWAEVDCTIHKGTLREAILFAAGCNETNGLRRSNADKHAAVTALLNDPEWVNKPDSWIADAANVSFHIVAECRKKHTLNNPTFKSESSTASPEKKTGRDGKRRPAKYKTRKEKAAALHVPPIDEEIGTHRRSAIEAASKTTTQPITAKPKSFDAERNLVRALADLSSLIKRTHYDADIDKGRIAHELNELANEVAEAIEEAEAA